MSRSVSPRGSRSASVSRSKSFSSARSVSSIGNTSMSLHQPNSVDDIFDSSLNLEDTHYKEGYSEGYSSGLASEGATYLDAFPKYCSHWHTFPQIFINGEFIGGSDIILNMHRSGELKEKLKTIAANQGKAE